eukprot:1358825-Amorphochlora_amoeboformis.AAC.1
MGMHTESPKYEEERKRIVSKRILSPVFWDGVIPFKFRESYSKATGLELVFTAATNRSFG